MSANYDRIRVYNETADSSSADCSNRLNIPAQQTLFVQLSNMFTEESVNMCFKLANPSDGCHYRDTKAGPDWHLDVAEDIKGEVESKYGPVDNIFVDRNSQVSLRCTLK